MKEDLVVFNHKMFEIKDYENFFNHLKKDYNYIVIDDYEKNELKGYIEKFSNYEWSQNDEKFYFENLRDLLHYYSFGKSLTHQKIIYMEYKLLHIKKVKWCSRTDSNRTL